MEAAIEICPTTTLSKVNEGALLVDVREKNEADELSYDVPNILHIPLSAFEDRYTEVPKDREVILVCRSGGRSLKATYFLMNHGWTNVMNMQHGMIRWAKKGFPMKGNVGSVLENTASGNATNSSCC